MSHTYRSRFENAKDLSELLADLCINELFTENDLRLLSEYRQIYFGPEALISQAAANKAFKELCEADPKLAEKLKLTPLGVIINESGKRFHRASTRNREDQEFANLTANTNIQFLRLWDKYRQLWKDKQDDIDALITELKKIVDEGDDSVIKVPATIIAVLASKGFVVPDSVKNLKPSQIIEGFKIEMQREDGVTVDVTFAGDEFNVHVDAGANVLTCKAVSTEINEALTTALADQALDPFGEGIGKAVVNSGFGSDELGPQYGLETTPEKPVAVINPSNANA